MSKIEAFKNAMVVSGRIASDIQKALGRDSKSNDKHAASCRFAERSSGAWSDIVLSLHLSYGYYGSSSGYSATSDELGRYFAKAVNARMSELLDECVKMAMADVEKLRKEAESEALAVLKETGHAA